MPTKLVIIGGLDVSKTPGDRLKTIGLGSCVAIVLTESITRAIGMAHIVLPKPGRGEDTRGRPAGHFADPGIANLIQAIKGLGSSGHHSHLTVKIAGGAATGNNNASGIGKRNVLAVKRALWRMGLTPVVEETGGSDARTVEVDVNEHEMTISLPGQMKVAV